MKLEPQLLPIFYRPTISRIALGFFLLVFLLDLSVAWPADLAPMGLSPKLGGRTLYVSPTGADDRSGLSLNQAFGTLQHAADATQPGDTVFIMEGTYSNARSDYSALLRITRSGTEQAPIRYCAYPGHKPRLLFDCYQGIRIAGASYIEIQGLEMDGSKAGITLELARQYEKENRADCDNDGIVIGPMGDFSKPTLPFPHHVRVVGNTVHHCAGAGISAYLSDYVIVESNVVHSCAWYSPWAKSGINLGWGYNSDENTLSYKNIIRGNLTHDNANYIPWRTKRKITDGNGIIVDSMRNQDRNKKKFEPYRGLTLVQSNLSVHNGGSGMHAFLSDHVHFDGNISYQNAQVVKDGCEMFGMDCTDVLILNNIIAPRPGGRANDNRSWHGLNQDLFYDYNTYLDPRKLAVRGIHDQIADPLFIRPTTNVESADFRLQAGSPHLQNGYSGLEEWKRVEWPRLREIQSKQNKDSNFSPK